MATTPGRKLNIPAGTTQTRSMHARNISDCVNFASLAAATNKVVDVPAGAQYVEIETDLAINFRFGATAGAAVAVTPSADVTNGSGNQGVRAATRELLVVPKGSTKLGLISAGTAKVSLAYFK